MGIGCYGPALDTRGNSIGGIYTMERLSDTLKLHVFDAENDTVNYSNGSELFW